MTLTALERNVLAKLAQRFREPPPSPYPTPGALAKAIDPTTLRTPALDLIDSALVDVEEGRCDRLILSMPPQEGKSTRVTKFGPLWALIRNPDRRIVIVSYSSELANDFGRDIRNYITNNQGEDGTLDLGLRIAPANGAYAKWKLAGHRGGVRSVGLAGGVTGRSADMLFIDDPVANRERADSEAYRRQAKGFWTSTAGTRLAPGAPVILVLTRWHEDDLAGWLLGREDGYRWRVINIPAQADHDPNKGETDPLGREPGEFMQSARINERTGQPRTRTEWEQIRVQAGSRDWQALYQGRPSPPEGGLLKRDWWQYYDQPQWVERDNGARHAIGFDTLLMSWDMAFKDLDSSDWVVGQVWGRRGARAFLLDQVRARMSFVDTCSAVRRLAACWPQAAAKLIENKANGTAVLNALSRVVAGMIGIEPDGSKVARASAVSPFVEAGNIFLPAPELAPWVGDFVEECAAFPSGRFDDQVDTFSQAVNRLLLNPLLVDDDIFEDEEQADAEGSISMY